MISGTLPLEPASDIDADIERIGALLHGYRFRHQSEIELQNGIEQVLKQQAIAYLREKSLGETGRPDFSLAGGLALEVKTQGSFADALRQVARYLRDDAVRGVLLVGTPHWIDQLPREVNGKPLAGLRLLGSLL